jgi:hypothetical protein
MRAVKARALLLRLRVSSSGHNRDVEHIARELEGYVGRHLEAADTLDGIARWWLARPVQPALDDVEAALDILVRRKLLSRRSLPDGNTLYARVRTA